MHLKWTGHIIHSPPANRVRSKKKRKPISEDVARKINEALYDSDSTEHDLHIPDRRGFVSTSPDLTWPLRGTNIRKNLAKCNNEDWCELQFQLPSVNSVNHGYQSTSQAVFKTVPRFVWLTVQLSLAFFHPTSWHSTLPPLSLLSTTLVVYLNNHLILRFDSGQFFGGRVAEQPSRREDSRCKTRQRSVGRRPRRSDGRLWTFLTIFVVVSSSLYKFPSHHARPRERAALDPTSTKKRCCHATEHADTAGSAMWLIVHEPCSLSVSPTLGCHLGTDWTSLRRWTVGSSVDALAPYNSMTVSLQF